MNVNNMLFVFIFLLGLGFLFSILFIGFTQILNRIQYIILRQRIIGILKEGAKDKFVESIIDLNLLKLQSENIEQRNLAINSIMSMQKEWKDDLTLKKKIINSFVKVIESDDDINNKLKLMKLISELIN